MNRILAIDDNEDTLNMIKATISTYIPECSVIFAHSGHEGIHIARNEMPDTILLDIMMPEMNGFEVCEALKSDNNTKHIPIIFFSGHAKDTSSIIKGLDLGAEMFLKKPIQPSELAAQVRVMLRIKKAEDLLKTEIQKYRIMAETLPDSVVTINLNEEITYLSPRVIDLFDLNKDLDHNMKNAYQLLFSHKPENVRQMLNEVMLLGNKRDVEIPLTTANGTFFNAELSAALITDESNDPIEFIIVIKDVTERKLAQNKLLDYQNNLKQLNKSLTFAEDKERKEIALNLHDGIGQTLSLARMNLTSISTSKLPNEINILINESARLINDAISETRSITVDLSPPILFELGLIPALQWKLKQVGEKHGFKTSLKIGDHILSACHEIKILLYRVVSELLANAIKHSKADTLQMEYYEENNKLIISLKDNGVGFDITTESYLTNNGGYGLFSIKERLDSIQGSLKIFSELQKGTQVIISIPI